jgi:triosephosphate isomerase
MPRKFIVAGNWKMNNNLDEAQKLASEVIHMIYQNSYEHVEVMLAPPFLFTRTVAAMIEPNNSSVSLGAQNCHSSESGAFTGEISAGMLKSVGCKYVILGHSERREFFGETNQTVNEKVKIANAAGLLPILCLGESLSQRESGAFKEIIGKQIKEGLSGISADQMKSIVLAYEPIWAIGTGKTASPKQAQEVHMFIRESIANLYDPTTANNTSILYGGSCKPDNAAEIFAMADVDGGLIGGAALKSKEFITIAKELSNSVKATQNA